MRRDIKIAVICATTSSELNPGMISADLGVFYFMDECCLAGQIDLFSIDPDAEVVNGIRTLHYQQLLDPEKQLSSYDLIVYWGDFLHAFNYLEYLVKAYGSRWKMSASEVRNRLYKLMLLEGAPTKLQEKTLVLSGTIVINNAFSYSDRYTKALSELYQNSIVVAPRDPVSLAMSSRVGGRVMPGVDGAFYLPCRKATQRHNVIGLQFGRCVKRRKIYDAVVKRFVTKLAKKLLVNEIVNLGWLEKAAEVDLPHKIDKINQCRLIVTDTYHCAVTAWREGVPAVCIGFGTAHFNDTLNDKKKELLYMMFQAQELYVYMERLLLLSGTSGAKREAARIASVLNDQSIVRSVCENITTSKARYVESIVAELDRHFENN
jgi:polysaccharide pyruvyl transferase WcaK-like protein